MDNFKANVFYSIGTMLGEMGSKREQMGDDTQIEDASREIITTIVDAVRGHCQSIKLERSTRYAADIIRQLEPARSLTNRELFTLFVELDKHIRWDMEAELFMYVPPDRAKYVNNERLLGDEVFGSFRTTRFDILEAGNCLAFGNYTASVFQFMRVAERGLRQLAKRVKVTVSHNKSPIPLEYGEWDKVIIAIKNKIEILRPLPSGPKRQAKLEIYSDAADHCLFMKDIWRNTVSHTRKPYNETDALAVMSRVGDFMRFLAKNLRGI
jgi:hypothetical protein